jgi:hypothetical protein
VKKTILTIEVQYDPTFTDPEGLASAMDRLLETVLSTPGIMEEYGNPVMGEFLAPPEKPPAGSSSLIVLNMYGGVVRDVFASFPAEAVVVDWNTEDCDPTDPVIVKVYRPRRRPQRAAVLRYPASALDRLAGTDTGAALEEAGITATERPRELAYG